MKIKYNVEKSIKYENEYSSYLLSEFLREDELILLKELKGGGRL